ncbi:MAG TPA: DUF2905 domain-containing protein [Stellaceae bacterium]|nr:DUF2905 domain-containing protein [Stellaceae bacterium]
MMQRLLIVLGLVLLLAGLAWPWLARLGLGRLPGDIAVRHGNFAFYFPIVTCLLISVALSLLLWFINR